MVLPGVCQPCAVAPEFIPQTWFAVPLVLRFVAVVALVAFPASAAVIVPAAKLPLPSRSTTVEAVFAVAYAIDDVTVVAEAATGNWPVVMPEMPLEVR